MAANSQARQKAVLDALRKGNTRRAACAFAGIHHDTLYEWIKEPTFSDAVEKAEAEAEFGHVANIKAAGDNGNWQASAWWLERNPRTKKDWRRDELDLRRLTTEQLLELAAALESRVESAGDRAAIAGETD